MVAFLDDIQVTTEGNRNTRREKQTEKDIYDAYQNISKCALAFFTIHFGFTLNI